MKVREQKQNNTKIIHFFIDIIVIVAIFGFLLTFFKPELIFSKTTTTGGDMASHYYTGYYMKNYLLSHGELSGWTPGNYAGFPILHYYFPLPFFLIAILGFIMPLQISFKIVTVLGIFLLPVTAYLYFRLIKHKFPVPIIGATLTLLFLFVEEHSMWGGNIPSTLAGEFTYSIGLALSIIFLGTLYKGITEKRFLILNSILLALIGLSHVYSLLFAGLSSLFFLMTIKDFKQNLRYLAMMGFLAFMLLSFWLIPLLASLEYTTSYSLKWLIANELVPKILLPTIIISLTFPIFLLKRSIREDSRIHFLLFSIAISIFLFFFASALQVVDIRFIPFIHFLTIILGASLVGEFIHHIRLKEALPFIVMIATILWVNYNTHYIPDWIKWNYEGFESKKSWSDYNEINQFLKGNFNDPRVVYEHSTRNNMFGTERAFESLPYFSGRATLEGVYMQSSLSAPAIFYIQSEIGEQASCPFPTYQCTGTNVNNGIKHLMMFNVKHYIALSHKVKKELRNNSNVNLVKASGDYEIYELLQNKNRYVDVPLYEPVAFPKENWKNVSYEWFKRFDLIDVPLIFTDEKTHFKYSASDINNLPKLPLKSSCNIKETIKEEEILFTTDCINQPHIIKMSYFPNWKVEGAEKIYLISPAFMMVYPTKNVVRLYYGRTNVDIVGIILTICGISIHLFNQKWKKYF